MKNEVCKLCGEEKELKESHIVPKSLYKWIKDTSATGKLRKGVNINLPIQDGIKMRLLCGECEQKFGQYEKLFKENIFIPVNQSGFTSEFDYDPDLFYFILSVWWRTIQWSLREDEELKNSKFLPEILACEKQLKDFLLTYRFPIDFDKVYLFLTGFVEKAPREFKNINHFFLRSIDPFIMFDEESCFFALKIPQFWFYGNIVGLDESKLKSIRIYPEGGKFTSMDKSIEEIHISNFIHQRLTAYNNLNETISEVQQSKITDNHRKNIEKFRSSKSYEAWIMDRIREEE